jgi:hypothetical protein
MVTLPGRHGWWLRHSCGSPDQGVVLRCPMTIFKHMIELLGTSGVVNVQATVL